MPKNDAPLPNNSMRGQAQKRLESADPGTVIERILDSAETVLRRNGYAGFSTRRVAQEADIALGNLTYHFPTKPGLVRALIDRLMSKYLEAFDASLQKPENGLQTLIQLVLEETVNDEAMALFREIWVMALHDTTVRDSIDDFYNKLIQRVSDVLIAAHPKADPQAISDLVHLMASVSEGSSVIYGTRRARSTSHEQMTNLAVRLVSEEIARINSHSVGIEND